MLADETEDQAGTLLVLVGPCSPVCVLRVVGGKDEIPGTFLLHLDR